MLMIEKVCAFTVSFVLNVYTFIFEIFHNEIFVCLLI